MPEPRQPWPHAPPHHFTAGGTYMVTAATFQKKRLFHTPAKLDLFRELVFEHLYNCGVKLQAWAFFANHYHVIVGFEDARSGITLSQVLRDMHYTLARRLNAVDGIPGRRVIYQHWDTALTYEKSWLARLNYVHQNPVKHELVPVARDYPWCSARWFETNAAPAFVKTIGSFKTDRVNVPDDF